MVDKSHPFNSTTGNCIKTTPLKRTTSKVTLLETKIRKKMSLMQYQCVFGTLNLCMCLSERSTIITGKSRLLSIHQESMRFLQVRKIPSVHIERRAYITSQIVDCLLRRRLDYLIRPRSNF